ncbi:MAG: hypothetical protein ABI658_13275 [Acidimicrobiales bacterium]
MTAIEDSLTGSRLGIVVGPDAAVCLDLVLDDVGVHYHYVRVKQGGARVIIDLVDDADGYRIVDVLRQHLGAELREATIYRDGHRTPVACNPTEGLLVAPWVEPWRSVVR